MKSPTIAIAVLVLSGCPETVYQKCVKRGEAYYKEIGSYPTLSDGREASKVIGEMCVNAPDTAFSPP